MLKTGTVRWFNETKGFGFIESGGVDYFLHYSELNIAGFKTVQPGQKVEFKATKTPKGYKAECVTVI